MRERLELVTAFDDIGIGVIVVIKPCDRCGRRHRGIVTDRAAGVDVETGRTYGDVLYLEPPGSCVAGAGHYMGITPAAVARRNVYRVVDGLEDSTSTPTRKKRSVRA